MQIKIYVDEAPIYITDELSEELKKLSIQKDVVCFKEEFDNDANKILALLQINKKKAVIIFTKDFETLQYNFFKQFTLIEAAGGIVQNENKDVLFIYRRGKWDLPKGKMENGETPEICAEREIEEETGVKDLQLKYKIGETYHVYSEWGQTILKTCHWFNFTTVAGQETVPQKEEDIAEVKWVHTVDIKEPMKNTYQNIKDILTLYFDSP
jgi:8-oxo-dGTP pyrophosphatase MutT (NUDIX family)